MLIQALNGLVVELIMGAIHITAQPTAQPVSYVAQTQQGPSIVLGMGHYTGWVNAAECFNRCKTLPGVEYKLLQGELPLDVMADVELVITRDGVPVLTVDRSFFGGAPAIWIHGSK